MNDRPTTWRIPGGLPEATRSALRRYRAAVWRRTAVLRLSQALILAGCVVLAGSAFDRLVDVAGGWRRPLPLLAVIALLVPLYRMLAECLRNLDVNRLAQSLDRACGDRREHLRAALDFNRPGVPANFFTTASMQAAAERCRDIDPADLIDRRRARRWLSAALLGAVLAAGLWQVPDVRAPLLWRRFWDPAGNHMRPTSTWFTFELSPPGPWLTGDELEIHALLAGRKSVPAPPLIHVRRENGTTTVRTLEQAGPDRYQTGLRQLSGDIEWYVSMGPARSARHLVPVIPRPTVTHITATYHYPRYARMSPVTESLAGRTISALEGSRVQLTVRSNVPLDRVEAYREDERVRFRVDRDDPHKAVLHRIVRENHQLHLDLQSAEGIDSRHEPPLTFRAIPDNPPSVSIVNDLAGRAFFLTDTIDIEYRAQDDLGLAALFIRALDDSVRPRPAIIDVDLADYGARHAEGRIRIPVADLLRGETRTLRLTLQAQDTAGQEGLSPTVTIQIAAESFDRQMRRLLLAYAGRPGNDPATRGLQAPQAHEQQRERLRNAANRAAMLADMLEPEQKPGEHDAATVRAVRSALAASRPPLYYGGFWFNDFVNAPLLPRFRQLGADANVWSWLVLPVEALHAGFDNALAQSNPKPAVEQAARQIARAADGQSAILLQIQTDHAQVVRELIGYLAARTARQLADAGHSDWIDTEFLVRQRGAIREIEGQLDRLPASQRGSRETADLLTAAAAGDSGRDELEAAAPELDALAAILNQAAEQEAVTRRLEDPMRRTRALDAAAADSQATTILASGLLMDGDAMDSDERLLLDRALNFIRLQAGADNNGSGLHHDDAFLGPEARDGIAFDVFQALLKARTDIEAFRLGLSNREFALDSPHAEAAWLRVREARIGLLAAARRAPDDGLRAEIQAVTERLAPFATWLVEPGSEAIAFLETMRQQEQACERLARRLAPGVRHALRTANERIAGHLPLLEQAIAAYQGMVAAEMAYYEDTRGRDFHNMQPLKVRLAGLTTAALKLLDFSRLAALHGVDEQHAVERAARIFVALGRTLQHFEEHVEAIFWTHRYGIHTRGYDDDLWRGKVNAYARLHDMLADVRLLAGPAGIGSPEVEAAVERLQIGFTVRTKLDMLAGALRSVQQAAGRDAADGLPQSIGGDNAVVLETALYLVRLVRGMHAGDAAWTDQAARQLRLLPELPADVYATLEALTPRSEPAADDLRRLDDVAEQLLSMLPPRPTEPPPTPHVQETFTFHVDWSAIRRDRQRRQERLLKDQRNLDRRRLGRVLNADGRIDGNPVLAWAYGEREINRRKAGLAQNRLELGAVATGTETAAVNLPDHIYRELKRAREGAMPELFRNESFDYLNRILEKARP